ncbi:MAG TPA: hypothetical protein VL003_00595 [Pusillimonas sp.]|uniref:hypothetical protein n=1 Tax=Pusillimonas sp. TaxID=3040095 RepID=UPI002C8A6DDC|nr:hypothetical protein [Pusillimonas sp.]HUH86535.1 hypothetical protein [Pusillimonas sp.]
MRLLVLLIMVVNLGLFAFGQGYFGVPPSEAGRSAIKLPPINSDTVRLGEPTLNAQHLR